MDMRQRQRAWGLLNVKLLVVSHACVTAVNQAFFADVARLANWTVDIAVPASWDSEWEKGAQPSRWSTFDGKLIRIPVWKSGSVPLHVYRQMFLRLLRAEKPDAIYVHHEPYGLATAQLYLANRVTGRVPIGFYAAQNILKNYPPPFRWLEHYVLRHSDFSFPVTDGALEVLRTKGYTGNAEVLPLALDQNVYSPRVEWAKAKRRELGIPSEGFCFGYLGRFVEEKGLLSFLKAAASLRDLSWNCLLVGNGPQEAELRAAVASLRLEKHILFHGYVPHQEVAGWLTLFDALVLPSETRPNWKEQFGRVIVEANACETPVIGTDSGEIRRVVESTGGGVMVPEADPASLAAAMRAWVLEPHRARELALVGAAAARTLFDQERLARRFIAAIESSLPSGARA